MENSGGFFPQTFSLSKHNMINEEIDRHESMPRLNAKFPQSQGNPVHFRTKNAMIGYQKENLAEKTQKKIQKRQMKNRAKKTG